MRVEAGSGEGVPSRLAVCLAPTWPPLPPPRPRWPRRCGHCMFDAVLA